MPKFRAELQALDQVGVSPLPRSAALALADNTLSAVADVVFCEVAIEGVILLVVSVEAFGGNGGNK